MATVEQKFREQIVDRLPEPDAYEKHDGHPCVIVDNRNSIDILRAMKSVKAIMPDANIIHYQDSINSIEDYDALLTSVEFWGRFSNLDITHVLIFQPDSLMLNAIDPSCFSYSYIGAPWDLSRKEKYNEWIGNGGFSLRNIEIMKHICRNKLYKHHHEDVFFGKFTYKPPFDIANKFAVEWHYYPYPTGIHDAESHLSQKLMEKMLYNSKLYQIAKQY